MFEELQSVTGKDMSYYFDFHQNLAHIDNFNYENCVAVFYKYPTDGSPKIVEYVHIDYYEQFNKSTVEELFQDNFNHRPLGVYIFTKYGKEMVDDVKKNNKHYKPTI